MIRLRVSTALQLTLVLALTTGLILHRRTTTSRGLPGNIQTAAIPSETAANAPSRRPSPSPIPSAAPRFDGPPALLEPADRRWNRPLPEPEFEQFRLWANTYLAASPLERANMIESGTALAQVRREQLKDLIQSDPRLALKLALPVAVRRQMPPGIAELLEERIDGRGDLNVIAALPREGTEASVPPTWRTAQLGDRTFMAYTFGRRVDEPTRRDIPLHGLALDNQMAVDENPVRILEAEERETRPGTEPVCGVAGWPADVFGTELAVDTGDDIPAVLCSPAHAEELNRKLIQAESQTGSTELTAEGIVRPASAYTEGIKRLVLIRVDFPDKTGEPFSSSKGTTLVTAIDQFYQENSYGRAGFQPVGEGSAVTPTLRLPRSTTEYGSLGASKLRDDARTAARNAGFVLSNYDFDVICFHSVPGFGWAGLGYVGSPGAWVQDAFDDRAGVFCHELGHNFGLNHANFWDTAGESILGAKGTSVEYGDTFDTMGNAAGGRRQFNVRNKAYLNWLRGSTEIQSLSASGTFRLYAHDATNASGIRALRAVRDAQNAYWFEYRARFADSRWMSNGIGVRRARSDSSRQSQLLDTTPGSPDGKNDSALVIGRTFSDPVVGIHVTPIQLLKTDPPSVEVVVNRGLFQDDQPPSLNVTASATSVPVNTTVTLRANATDPDGDSLAFAWDFGDAEFGSNSDTVTHQWTAAGEYTARCVVSDMKGKTRSDYVVVRVGSPGTFRLSGMVRRDGLPLDGVRVFVSNTRMTYTGFDGTYVLTGLTSGQYAVKAQTEGLLFTRDGFSNPVSVAPSRSDIDFIGAPPGDLEFATLVPAGAEWRYLDNGSNAGTAWRASNFDDSAWKRGPAQLGYGDDDVVTTIGFGPDSNNKYITSYFRHEFVVEEPGRILSATLGVMRDDGAVVYLNGKEVHRSNMPSGTITYRTPASSAVQTADESTYYETDLSGTDFLAGRNVLAVEIHQSSAGSTDVSFNLRLDALLSPATGVGLFPELATEITTDGVTVSWPSAFTGYSLQVRSSLGADGDWQPVDAPIESLDGRSRVVLPATDSIRFLRLNR